MKKVVLIIFCLFLTACATGKNYTVPPEEYAQQVKTLGVLPLLVDTESINYYSRDGLVALLNLYTTTVQQQLIDKLRDQGRYFDVRPVSGAPDDLLTLLVAGQERVGDGAATRLNYTFSPRGSSQLADQAVVDAVLVVVVHGIQREEKRWSSYSMRMEYLTADYSSLLYTASVVAPDGRVLWQLDMPADEVLLRLDYPDFTESYWNRAETVRVKSISLDGLRRTLKEPDTALLVDKNMPKPFSQMLDRIVQQMK